MLRIARPCKALHVGVDRAERAVDSLGNESARRHVYDEELAKVVEVFLGYVGQLGGVRRKRVSKDATARHHGTVDLACGPGHGARHVDDIEFGNESILLMSQIGQALPRRGPYEGERQIGRRANNGATINDGSVELDGRPRYALFNPHRPHFIGMIRGAYADKSSPVTSGHLSGGGACLTRNALVGVRRYRIRA